MKIKQRWMAFLLSVMMVVTYMPSMAFAAADGKQTITLTPEVKTAESNVDLADNDELLMGYMEKGMEVKARSKMLKASKSTRGDKLDGYDRVVYEILKNQLSLIASGDIIDATLTVALKDIDPDVYKDRYTAEELGVSAIVEDGAFTEEAVDAMYSLFSFDFEKVFNALLADMPYELYWFDKTQGCMHSGPTIGASGSGGVWTAYFGDAYYTFYFSGGVAEEYQGDQIGSIEIDGETVDLYEVARTDAVSAAIVNAQAIREKYASESDFNKLIGYRDEICEMTSYNDAAADETSNTPYGNPWQLIYVFDGDDSTKVVCEGYSKAFQFLCDNTSFKSSKISSDSVTGIMRGGTGAGAHMWNILAMDDGRNYLADITNSDEGTVGQNGELFLKGYTSGSVTGGYNYSGITYNYDDETFAQYDISELSMSESDYAGGEDDPGDYEWTFDRFIIELGEGTAQYYCEDLDEYKSVECVVTVNKKESTCEEAGYEKMTASISAEKSLDGQAHEEVIYDDVIPAQDHDWLDPTYEWSDDYSKVTARIVCGNDKTHIKAEETVNTTSKRTIPTLGNSEKIKYTAVFENTDFTTQTKTVTTEAEYKVDCDNYSQIDVGESKDFTFTLCRYPNPGDTSNYEIIDDVEITFKVDYQNPDYKNNLKITEKAKTSSGVTYTFERLTRDETTIEIAAWTSDGQICFNYFDQDPIDDPCAGGHSWDDGIVTTDPTCTEVGVMTYTCTVCGETKTEAIPALRHDLKAVEAKDATFEADGNSAYWVCNRCHKYFSDAEGKNEIAEGSWVIPKLNWDTAVEQAEDQIDDADAKAAEAEAAAEKSIDENDAAEAQAAAERAVKLAEMAEKSAEEAYAAAQKTFDNLPADASDEDKANAQKNVENAATNLAVAKQLVVAANSTVAKAKKAAAKIASNKAEAAKEAAAKAATYAEAVEFGEEAAGYAGKATDLAELAEMAATAAADSAAEIEKLSEELTEKLGEEFSESETAKAIADAKTDADTSAGSASESAAAADTASDAAKVSSADAKAAVVEKARQGDYDKKIPKVKIKKPTSKKTSITVKWTKLTSKQLNSSKATKYEIWVCPNTKFAKKDTKIYTVSKSKSSKVVKGLKKNKKYYVKVRAIKYVNGVKKVGKWSKVKAIKTKKK